MTSRTSLHKLIRFELKKSIWLYAITLLILVFIQPISLLMRIEVFRTYAITQADMLNNLTQFFLYSFSAGSVLFIAIAFVYGMFYFSYVYSGPAVDLYHSLAITRGRLFTVKYLCGLVPVLIMEFLTYALCLLTLATSGLSDGHLTAVASYMLLVDTLAFLMGLNLMLIAIMLTGRQILGVLGAVILTGFSSVALVIVKTYKLFCYQTYYSNYDETPFWQYLINPMSVTGLCSDDFSGKICIVMVMLAEAVALGFIALFLYQKRPSEKTHSSLCYNIAKPIIRIPLVILAALGGGLYISFFSNTPNPAWFWISFVVVGVLTHLLLEVIYEQDTRKLLKHPIQLVIGLVVSAGIAIFFLYDLGGYDRYIPNRDRVENVAIRMSDIESEISQYESHPLTKVAQYVDSDAYFMKNLHLTDVDTVQALAAIGIEELNPVRSALTRHRLEMEPDYYEYDPTETGFTVCYHMRSGSDIYRTYRCNIEKVYEGFEKIYSSKEYRATLYQLGKNIANGNISGLEGRDSLGTVVFDGTTIDIDPFLTAYLADLDSRQFADLKQYPLVRLSSFDNINYNDYLSGYYIYETDTNVIAYLESQGITMDDLRFNIDPEDIKTLKITNYDMNIATEDVEYTEDFEAYPDRQNTVIYQADTDKDKIRELAPKLVPESFRYSNCVLHPTIQALDIEVTYLSHGSDTYYYALPLGTEWR